MNNLKSVLQQHVPPLEAHLGGGGKGLQQDRLRKDLLAVSDKNRFVFNMGVGMLVALFIAAFILVWLWHDNPQLITAVFAGSGISITGVTATMFSHWKEKVRTDMLLALLSGTEDAETIKTVIGILANKL